MNMKELLTREQVLTFYSPKARTESHCESSSKGLNGILLQEDDTGRKHMVYVVSKKTTEAEAMYDLTKMELIAVILSVKNCVTYKLVLNSLSSQIAKLMCI